MVALVVAALLAASPTPEPKLKLAAPGLALSGVETSKGDLFLDFFAQKLVPFGVRVTTKNEISSLLGFERQKELLGCSAESTSCFAELGGALGVDGVITGSVGKVGQSFVVTLKILRAKDGQPLGSWVGRLESEDAVLDWLSATAQRFAVEQGYAQPGTAPALEASGPSAAGSGGGLRSKAWIPFVAGGALAIGGALFLLDARNTASQLSSGGTTTAPGGLDASISKGKDSERLGGLLLGLGGAALVTGALFVALGAPAPAQVSFAPLPGGAAVAICGSLP